MQKILLLLLFCAGVRNAAAQRYDNLWKQVRAAEEADKPQTAFQCTQAIVRKALAEHNDVQLLRASLMGHTYGSELAPDTAEICLERMEQCLRAERRTDWRALWQAALAKTYQARGRFRDGDDRERARAFFRASLERADTLVHCSFRTYLPLFTPQADSRYFGDDLLHVLAFEALQSGLLSREEVRQTYARLLPVYEAAGRTDALFLLRLDSLRAEQPEGVENGLLADDAHFQMLLSLLPEARKSPVGFRLYEDLVAQCDRFNATGHRAETNDSLLLQLAREGERMAGKQGGSLKNYISLCERPQASLKGRGEYTSYPADTLHFTLEASNLKKVTLRTTLLHASSLEMYNETAELPQMAKRHAKQARSLTVALDPAPPYRRQQRQVDYVVPAEPGVYCLQLIGDGRVLADEVLYVSALRGVCFSPGGGYHRVTLVDTRSGRPAAGASLVACTEGTDGKLQQAERYTADGQGVVEIRQTDGHFRDRQFFIQAPADRAAQPFTLFNNRFYGSAAKERAQLTIDLFTDRAIYRPGQEVSFSGVVYERRADSLRVTPDYATRVCLYNPNGKVVDSLDVKTDRFGGFSGRFRLPSVTLTGSFVLRTQGPTWRGSQAFRVEAYKRPSFEAPADPVRVAYALGDTVRLTGTARTFSGVPVAEARVLYTVSRSSWWRLDDDFFRPQSGEALTDAEGRFSFPVVLSAPEVQFHPGRRACFTYQVDYRVTAPNGETVQGSAALSAGTRRYWLEADVPARLCREDLPAFCVRQTNAAGQAFEVEGNYRLLDAAGQTAASGTFRTGRSFRPAEIPQLPSGTYSFIYNTRDVREADTLRLVLFGEADLRPADRQEPLFFYQRSNESGDSARVVVGTPCRGGILYYDLVVEDRVVERRRYQLTDSLLHFDLAWQPGYADGATAYFALVRNGQLFVQQASVVKPLPEKRLQLQWSSFRSQLQPGQHETWRLRVTHPDGRPAEAVLMARMYDASLDAFARSDWRFSRLGFARALPNVVYNWRGTGAVPLDLSGSFPMRWKEELHLQFTCWDPSLFNLSVYPRNAKDLRYGDSFERQRFLARSARVATSGVVKESQAVADAAAPARPQYAAKQANGATTSAAGSVELRKEFQETAFFLPALRTGADGETLLEFTLPQSLTRWHFTALAHDRAMNHGRLDTTVVVRKTLMAQLALPRFLRCGDSVGLPVSVSNLDSLVLPARLRLTLSSAFAPERPIEVFEKEIQLAAGQTQTLHFPWQSPDSAGLYVCRVEVSGRNFSDGEERLLPVLGSEVEVSTTRSFSLQGPGQTVLRVDTLFASPEATRRSLTVEITSRPLWYVLAALPALGGTAETQSATAWGERLYALLLGQQILKAHPEVAAWTEAAPDELDKLAHLQGQGLTDLTPWLRDAEAQRLRTQALRHLLQPERAAVETHTALAHLRALQGADGAWSWFKGMPGNAAITLRIATLLARAEVREGGKSVCTEILDRAIAFLEKSTAVEVRRMKENEARTRGYVAPISQHLVQYLYLRSLRGLKPDADARYLMDKLLPQQKQFTLHTKALSATVLAEAGQRAEARQVMESLVDHTVWSPETGRYFDAPRAEWSWRSYKIPTQCAAIEALEREPAFAEAVGQMRQWLLQAKRTQQWQTTQATADAAWILLQGETLGGGFDCAYTLLKKKKIVGFNAPQDNELPQSLGYVKHVYDASPATEATELRVDHRAEGQAWGQVTATYRLPAESVEAQGEGFGLTASLLVWRNGRWAPLQSGEVLNTGDKVRRVLTLRAERDYDFVRIATAHPACLEPAQPLSCYRSVGDLWAYAALHDTQSELFVERCPKGVHRISEDWLVVSRGSFTSALTEVECVYAPEFRAVSPVWQLSVE